jgi:type II secretory pathway pseudopilin PulG
MKTQKTGSSTFLAEPNPRVAQVSKPAVTPISKSANRGFSLSLRAWKPATRQTWKSALQAGPPSGQTAAFTLTELLVVIFTLAILGALLLPALASPQIKDQQLQCLSNLQQLQIAWTSYAGDNNGLLAQNLADDWGGWDGNTNDLGLYAPGNYDASWILGNATNGLLPNRINLITYGLIYPYVLNYTLYQCPANVKPDMWGVVTWRAYSMNACMGVNAANQWSWYGTPIQMFFTKSSDLAALGPANFWVFMEENQSTINDGCMVVDTQQQHAAYPYWIDLPGHYHFNSGCMAFADGHCQARRWTDKSILTDATFVSQAIPADTNAPDLSWLLARTSIPIQ